jgi:hypothetical protein
LAVEYKLDNNQKSKPNRSTDHSLGSRFTDQMFANPF